MDPFVLLDQAALEKKIPKALAKRVRVKSQYLFDGIRRVERASHLKYPLHYVEPTLPISESSVETGTAGVMYARVIPTVTQSGVVIVVQFTAALLAYGTKTTIEAVAAHEFTHYVDLVGRLSSMDFVSEERSTSLFEARYADSERVADPSKIFDDRALVRLVNKKFKDALWDDALNAKVSKSWIGKGLPTRRVPPEENALRVGVGSVLATSFDPQVVEKARSLRTAHA